MCLPIHQCSSFPRNVLHTCTTINLQKACKSSMTFSPSNHYTPFYSFLLFLSNSFAISSITLSLILSFLSFHPFHSIFCNHGFGIATLKMFPTQALFMLSEWNLIFNVLLNPTCRRFISVYFKSCWIV